VQDLHAERAPGLRLLGPKLTSGWQLLSISTLTSGLPFTVYSGSAADRSGIAGRRSAGSGRHARSVHRPVDPRRLLRFGSGERLVFRDSIDVPGGTGPNSGVFGTLGRDTFRGPALYDFDFALIKDTTWEAGPPHRNR
jgi:hypothetical protein